MQDLSSLVPGLVVSSMEGGNMVATNNIAMALPGSTPITPMPEAPNLLDPNLPMPKIPAEQLPVGTERERIHNPAQPPRQPPDPPGQFGGVTMGAAENYSGHGWTLTPSAGSSVS